MEIVNLNIPVSVFSQVQADIQAVESLMLAQTNEQHPDLQAALELIVKSGGKRIRPTITLLVGHMLEAPQDKLVTLAAAIELLHTATLIHDDLIDGSLLRRGMPTLNAQWSPGSTILTGDFVFARAAKLAADAESIPVMKIFSQTLATIVNGEITQLFSGHCQTERDNYYSRIYAKTASLFETSAWTAALISPAEEKTINSMKNYGYKIGMAFQIIDDILDFTGDPETIGKPVGGDLRQGLLTLPGLYYIEDHAQEPEVLQILQGDCPSSDELNCLVEKICASKSITKAHSEACRFIEQARVHLESQPPSSERHSLETLASFIVDRDL
ncbi:MAG: polyprenyl synthetase family protein [Anaerolineaceae bacterium]|nr:polyprenyl synthetase family protein [Anaerolineaceae bacterium]